MIQLRYLEDIKLCSRDRAVQSNGSFTESFAVIDTYHVQIHDIYDEVSASLYGSDLNNMIRITSPRNSLEKYLLNKVNVTSDNITKYAIKKDSFIYEIVSVKQHWVDVKFLCEISQISA